MREERILLGLRSARRTHYPGVWDVFGGHVCPGEHPRDALARELQEEIGVTPTSMSLLHIATHSGPAEHYEYQIYLITEWEGTPDNLQPEEHDQIGWVSPNDFNSIQLAHPAYVRLFRRALELTDAAHTSASP